MTVCMGRIVPKWLPFNNTGQNHKIFDVHMWGTHVHMYTKCEVSMFKLGVHRRHQ